MNRTQSRPMAWLALMAMSFIVLAPAVARFMSTDTRSASVLFEVCTGSGRQWIEAASDAARTEPAPTSGTVAMGDHCPLCKLSSDAIGLVTAHDLRVVAVGKAISPAPPDLHAPPTTWLGHARARGPPAAALVSHSS